MSQRRDLEHHRHSLVEIRNIMNSMKTLAYMETRKLDRFLDAQQGVVLGIETVAEDFLCYFPSLLPEIRAGLTVYLVIGSERGFCGDYNHALVDALNATLSGQVDNETMIVVVGNRLAPLLEDDSRCVATITGASVAEEVTVQLGQVVSELTLLQSGHPGLNLYCIYHSGDAGVAMKRLLPPFQRNSQRQCNFPYPPLLHLSPPGFLAGLVEHYLFAALYEVLYTSLMAENYTRLSHLEGAVSHLDDEAERLSRISNALRQEEIIEEIEVILLSTGGFGKG